MVMKPYLIGTSLQWIVVEVILSELEHTTSVAFGFEDFPLNSMVVPMTTQRYKLKTIVLNLSQL
jgi:hypothetical protein